MVVKMDYVMVEKTVEMMAVKKGNYWDDKKVVWKGMSKVVEKDGELVEKLAGGKVLEMVENLDHEMEP